MTTKEVFIWGKGLTLLSGMKKRNIGRSMYSETVNDDPFTVLNQDEQASGKPMPKQMHDWMRDKLIQIFVSSKFIPFS